MAARVPTLALAALLPAGSLDAGPGHVCAHHDALPGSGHAVAVDATAPARAHARPEAPAAPADEPAHLAHHPVDHGESSPAESSHDGACTCIGTCQAGGGMPLAVVDATRTIDAAAAPESSQRIGAEAAAPAIRTAYLLPYANAPPPIG